MDPKEIVEEAIACHSAKANATKHMNMAAKERATSTGLDKKTLLRLNNYDCFGSKSQQNTDSGEEQPDNILPVFKKLIQIIDDIRQADLLDALQNYIDTLSKNGINVTIDTTNEFEPISSSAQDVKDAILDLKGYQVLIKENTDKIKDVLATEAEEANISPKRKFAEIIAYKYKRDNGKDIQDSIQDKVVECEFYEKALNLVNDGAI